MNNDLFLRPCGYKRKRRHLLLDVLVLVAFAALAGWLWHCVKAAAVPVMMRTGVSALPSGPWLLAMAPVPDFAIGAAIAALGFLFAVAVGFGVRRLRAYDAEAALKWEAKPCEGDQSQHLASAAPCEDPLQALGLYQGLDAEDVGRIVMALLAECCEAEELVRKAFKPNPERAAGPVYCGSCGVLAAIMPGPDTRLVDAGKRMLGMRKCLSDLVKRFPVAVAAGDEMPFVEDGRPSVDASAFFRELVEFSMREVALAAEAGAVVKVSSTGQEVVWYPGIDWKKDTERRLRCAEKVAALARQHVNPSAWHRPIHGGYPRS